MGAGSPLIAYSGRVMKALALLSVCVCLLLPGTALAQDDNQQSLPDPNRTEQPKASASKSSSIPNTGVSVPVLVAAGVALLAGGAAVRPLRRRRRSYRADVWLEAVRSGASPD